MRLFNKLLSVVLAEMALPGVKGGHHIRRRLQLGHSKQAGRGARCLLRRAVDARTHCIDATTYVRCTFLGRARNRAAKRQEPVGQHEVSHELKACIVEHDIHAAVVHAAQSVPCIRQMVDQHKLLLLLAVLGAGGLQLLQVGVVQVGEQAEVCGVAPQRRRHELVKKHVGRWVVHGVGRVLLQELLDELGTGVDARFRGEEGVRLGLEEGVIRLPVGRRLEQVAQTTVQVALGVQPG